MSPTSRDPVKAAKQRANLVPGARTAEPGNRRAATHGGYGRIVTATLEAKTREVFDALAADAPLRGPDGGLPAPDAAQVTLLARCLVRLESVSEYLDRRGWESDDGAPRPAVELEARLRREAADHLDALGMSPRSRARLGLDLQRGFDLASEWAREDGE